MAAQAKDNWVEPTPPRKARLGVSRQPYRKPTQVGGGKSPKANGITLVKELGKMIL